MFTSAAVVAVPRYGINGSFTGQARLHALPGACTLADFGNVSGFAIVKGGSCPLYTSAELAAAAGISALLVVNPSERLTGSSQLTAGMARVSAWTPGDATHAALPLLLLAPATGTALYAAASSPVA